MTKPTVLLDSGAYTAMRKGIVIDIDKYAQYVIEHGHEYANCFNLDSIGNAKQSYLNWLHLKKLGAKTIPVYHIGTPEKWLKRYLDQTDYIALGAIANLDTSQRMLSLGHIWKTYLVDEKGFPKVKVHGLGLTAIDIMVRYPWFSVDSFTPVISAVWGSILLPRVDAKGNPHFYDLFICKASDQAVHKKGMTNSFVNLPVRVQEIYKGWFEEYGFDLGDIHYQKIRPRRGKEEKEEVTMFPELTVAPDTSTLTIANHWEVRMRWNLIIWNKLKERLPIYPRPFTDEVTKLETKHTGNRTIMYMGVSTTTHLEIFNTVRPKLDILISYAYLNETLEQKIKNYKG